MERDTELLLRVARMYYIQSETMEAIAHHMGVSRSTVSRLLKEAKDRGLVRVTITDPDRPMTRPAEIFRKNFHVQAHLVNVRPGSSYVLRLEQVAKVAARLLDEIVTDNDVVGVAWGTTVSAVAQHLRPRDLSGVTVVSLNGGANHRTTGLPYVGSILQRFAAAFHGDEQLLAGHVQLRQGPADGLLVVVARGGVDEAVAGLDGRQHDLADLGVVHLEDAEPDDGHLAAAVEGDGLHGRRAGRACHGRHGHCSFRPRRERRY